MPSQAEGCYRPVFTHDEKRVSTTSKSSLYAAFVLVVLAMASPAAGQGQAPRRIIGAPMQAVEHIPGVARLFEVRNASAPPRILPNEDFRLGEVVARFDLDLSDDDVLWLARRAGADRVVRKSPLGLFLILGPPSQVATERVMLSLWETSRAVMISPNYVSGGLRQQTTSTLWHRFPILATASISQHRVSVSTRHLGKVHSCLRRSVSAMEPPSLLPW